MRADRLLASLLLLQRHGRLSARVLAERLEVSERTVHRDMEALSMAGVPVYAERGRRGGWALAEDYRTDLTGLSEPELRGLVIAAAPSVLADLGLGAAAQRALEKVVATLPEPRRRTLEAARGHLHVDPAGWRRQDEAVPSVPLLDSALRAGRRVAFRYERAGDPSPVARVVDPLGLVVKGSTWYLVARVGEDVRTYRASRIADVRVLDEPAEPPPDFDLATYWAGSRAAFVAELPRYDGRLRVSPEALGRIRFGWRWGRIESEGEPDADGWVEVAVRWDTADVAVDYVLGLGPLADVLEPAELRDRVIAAARALLERATAR